MRKLADPLLSLRAVARLRGCTLRSVQRAVSRGWLPHVPVVDELGKMTSRVVRLSDAKAWSGPMPDHRRERA